MKEKISRKEIEALLPDYVFNNLGENEKTKFETAIIEYPDLEQEVEDGRELFNRIEQMDFDRILRKHTDYLPEKVVERLQNRNIPIYELQKKKGKWILPAGIAAAAILLLFVFTNRTENNEKKFINGMENSASTIIQSELCTFSELEMFMLSNELDNDEYFENEGSSYLLRDYFADNQMQNNYESEIDEIFYSTVEPNYTEYFENSAAISGSYDINQRIVIDNFAYINENDFQTIMENLNNATN